MRLTSPLSRPRGRVIAFGLVVAAVGFTVLYPVFSIVMTSLEVGKAAIAEPNMSPAIVNTLTLVLTYQGIAFFVSIPISWLLARTNLPFRHGLEFGFWVAFFAPTLTTILAFILLFDGQRGLINRLIALLPFVETGPFEIFSWWGIVFAHLATSSIAAKVIILTPAFRYMDASLEESGYMSGASTRTVLLRIVGPLMAPAILVATLLGLIHALESFEIELILGGPKRIEVYSTLIYRFVQQDPPQYGRAGALSLIILAIIVPLIVGQQWLSARNSRSVISGKFAARLYDLARWRWWAFALVGSSVAFMTIVPFGLVILSTFMTLFGFFDIPDPWTLEHWRGTLESKTSARALTETVMLSGATATVGIVVFSALAYLAVRTKLPGRGTLDFLTWVPTGVPGIVIGLGILTMFLQTPVLRPLYGSRVALILALLLASMTIAMQIIRSSLLQVGPDIEEAAWTSGATPFITALRILLPLLAPVVVTAFALIFALSAKNVSHIVLLVTGLSEPLSVVQLRTMMEGSFGQASVIGVAVTVLSLGVVTAGRWLASKFEIHQSADHDGDPRGKA